MKQLHAIAAVFLVGFVVSKEAMATAPTCEDLFAPQAAVIEINDGGQRRLDVVDSKTAKALASLNYQIVRADKSLFYVEEVVVGAKDRAHEYSNLLFTHALRAHPTIKIFGGILDESDEAIVLGNRRRGLTLADAVRETHIGRVMVGLGFTAIKIQLDDEDLDYHFEATRPSLAVKNYLGRSEKLSTLPFLLQPYQPSKTDQGLALLDIRTQNPIAVLEFEIHGAAQDDMDLDLMQVSPSRRREGLSLLLLKQVLQKYPHVRIIRGELHETNARVLSEGINAGVTPAAALKLTPFSKTMIRLGFTKMKIRQNPHSAFYIVTAEKP